MLAYLDERYKLGRKPHLGYVVRFPRRAWRLPPGPVKTRLSGGQRTKASAMASATCFGGGTCLMLAADFGRCL